MCFLEPWYCRWQCANDGQTPCDLMPAYHRAKRFKYHCTICVYIIQYQLVKQNETFTVNASLFFQYFENY